MVQVTDIGLGHAIKRRMKNKFVEHFAANSQKWQRGEVPPTERKKLYVRWLSEATNEFYTQGGQRTVETVFCRCGLRTPLDEHGPQLRYIKGNNEPIVVDWQKSRPRSEQEKCTDKRKTSETRMHTDVVEIIQFNSPIAPNHEQTLTMYKGKFTARGHRDFYQSTTIGSLWPLMPRNCGPRSSSGVCRPHRPKTVSTVRCPPWA